MTAIRPPRHTSLRHSAWPLCCRRCTGIAVDLGSSRTRAWALGRGLILDARTVAFPGSGTSHPVQRGTIIDPEGTSRMLDRLLGRRIPLLGHTVIALTTPVLGGIAYREAARAALQVLRPTAVLTIPTAKAIALATRADPSRPLLVVDVGAHLSEVFLLIDGEVADAHRTLLGTDDLDRTPHRELVESVVTAVTAMLRRDRTSQTLDALRQGVLLAGGGALRPEVVHGLSHQLHVPVRTAPAPHTAAVRGAARHLEAVHTHRPDDDLADSPPQRP